MEVRTWRRRSTGRRDPRIGAVQRRGIERSHQRPSLIGSDWRTIQPVDSVQWSVGRAERPLALGTVGDREGRELAGRIVPGKHRVAVALPPIVSLCITDRAAQPDLRPPRRRVDGDGIQFDQAARRALSAARNSEHDSRCAIGVGEREALRVEPEVSDGVGRPPLSRSERRTLAEHRIARRFVLAAARGEHSCRLRGPNHLRQRGFPARSEVEHAAAGRVPRSRTRNVHVDVVLI